MASSEISIRIHPNPQHGKLAVDIAFENCNAFDLRNHHRRGLKIVIEKISDLIKLSRRLEAVQNTLLESMQTYNAGEIARDRTRLARIDAHLQLFERSMIDAEDPGFLIKTFVLGTMDTTGWRAILPHGKQLWSWAAANLADVSAPSAAWLLTLLRSIQRMSVGLRNPKIKKLRDEIEKHLEHERALRPLKRRRLLTSRDDSDLDEDVFTQSPATTGHDRNQQSLRNSPILAGEDFLCDNSEASRSRASTSLPVRDFAFPLASDDLEEIQEKSTGSLGKHGSRENNGTGHSTGDTPGESGAVELHTLPTQAYFEDREDSALPRSRKRTRNMVSASPQIPAATGVEVNQRVLEQQVSRATSSTPVIQQQLQGMSMPLASGPAVESRWPSAIDGRAGAGPRWYPTATPQKSFVAGQYVFLDPTVAPGTASEYTRFGQGFAQMDQGPTDIGSTYDGAQFSNWFRFAPHFPDS